jgi:hypothetical protein
MSYDRGKSDANVGIERMRRRRRDASAAQIAGD